MNRKLKYFLTLLWFTYLIVSSVLLFKRGFLLTREVQDQNSTCLPLNEQHCGSNDQASNQENNCIMQNNKLLVHNAYDKEHNLCFKTNSRVILLTVDALRYDFTVFNYDNNKPTPYENKLPIIKDILTEHPDSSRLYKFIADPPTTTMQRIKGLTTGSLPTFIDAGANFATSEINEDNIIDQVTKNNGNIVFMGDDTWASLYPNRFMRNYPYPSFDVWDLDTVDNGVKTRLFSELNNTDWNLLIGHFLGVDHCGHRYGPNHPEMSRKLSEVNGVIEEVVKVMDDNSILFVIGDHGMTVTGDHGGESLDEIEAAMFIYSKRPLLSLGVPKNSVKQVDIVPTLSAILGIPIPFQNLGILITSALPAALEAGSSHFNNSWKVPLFWLWSNIRQVVNYIRVYSENSKIFDQEHVNLFNKEFDSLQKELKFIDSEERFVQFSEKATEFLGKIRMLCEEVWIQFDAFAISNGLTFLFLSIFFMFIISDGIPLKHLAYAIEGSFVVICVTGIFSVIILLAILDFYFMFLIDDVMYSSIFITHVFSHLMFLLPVFQNWDVISSNWYATNNKTYGIINLICRFILIFSIAGLFSNSFINEESSVLLFLLITILILSLLGVASFLRTDSNKRKGGDFISMGIFVKLAIASVMVLALLRASMYFWRCRVEQEWCYKIPEEIANTLKSQSSKFQWGISVISFSITIILIKAWLRKCGNLNGYSASEILTRLIPSTVIVCIAGFWVLQRLSGNTSQISRTSNYLALSVYFLCVMSIIVLLVQPICVSVIMKNGDGSYQRDEEHNNVISSIFNKLKQTFSNSEINGRVPVVCGLGTAYSAVYIILGTYLALLIALVLGNTFAFSVVIMMVVGTFFLFVTSVLRIKQADSLDDLLNVPSVAVLGWALIAQYFFYASGHQPAFSNVAWESASIGTSGLITNNFVLGTLIILNTFGSHILAGMLVPLLIVAPFTLLIMTPSVYGKQKDIFENGGQKGEMILFEKDRMTTGALFAVSCKYIAVHTLKVFASMLAATIHCRHLMVWNVFAPKFIFEAIGLFITLGSVLVGYLIFLRINSQVEKLVNKLNKMN